MKGKNKKVEVQGTENQVEHKGVAIITTTNTPLEKKVENNFQEAEIITTETKLSFGDILEKHSKIQKLIERFESLNQTFKKLDSFNIGNGRFKDQLVLQDAEGNEFATHNTQIIDKVIVLIKNEVEEKMGETETEIKLFEAA